MKDRLTQIIKEIIDLLNSCGYGNKAIWFEEKLLIIEKEDSNSEEFKTQLREVKKIISGMGSFSDLSLVPKPNSGITEEQASQRQWKLAEELGEVIGKLLSTPK